MNNYLRTTSTPRVQASRILQKHAYRAALNLIIDLGNQFKNVPPKVSISALNAAAVLLCCCPAYTRKENAAFTIGAADDDEWEIQGMIDDLKSIKDKIRILDDQLREAQRQLDNGSRDPEKRNTVKSCKDAIVRLNSSAEFIKRSLRNRGVYL